MRGSRRARAWLLTGVGIIAVVSLLVASWWFLWVPNWRPSLKQGERFGIDVSAHQGVIDWPSVARDGITFAYIKATEGGDFTDARFDQNWVLADRAGLARGAYHFFTLCSPGADQARQFLRVAPPDDEALPPAVDLELVGNCSSRPPQADVYGQLADFLSLIEDAWGREAILYVGGEFEDAYPVRNEFNRPGWQRRFIFRPETEDWLIWQVHGYAHVDGIVGKVDLDVMRGSP